MAQFDSMQAAIHRDTLADALRRHPETLYEAEAVFEQAQGNVHSTIIRLHFVPKADTAHMHLPTVVVENIVLRIEVIGTNDVSDLTLREAGKFLADGISAGDKRRMIEREKDVSL